MLSRERVGLTLTFITTHYGGIHAPQCPIKKVRHTPVTPAGRGFRRSRSSLDIELNSRPGWAFTKDFVSKTMKENPNQKLVTTKKKEVVFH